MGERGRDAGVDPRAQPHLTAPGATPRKPQRSRLLVGEVGGARCQTPPAGVLGVSVADPGQEERRGRWLSSRCSRKPCTAGTTGPLLGPASRPVFVAGAQRVWTGGCWWRRRGTWSARAVDPSLDGRTGGPGPVRAQLCPECVAVPEGPCPSSRCAVTRSPAGSPCCLDRERSEIQGRVGKGWPASGTSGRSGGCSPMSTRPPRAWCPGPAWFSPCRRGLGRGWTAVPSPGGSGSRGSDGTTSLCLDEAGPSLVGRPAACVVLPLPGALQARLGGRSGAQKGRRGQSTGGPSMRTAGAASLWEGRHRGPWGRAQLPSRPQAFSKVTKCARCQDKLALTTCQARSRTCMHRSSV